MLIDRHMVLIAEKEKLNSNIKAILNASKSIKKDTNKKIKASIKKYSINFFSLNLATKKLFANIPRPKTKRYRVSIKELKATGTSKPLK